MTDSTDPRSPFRLPARDCGSCAFFYERFLTPHDKGDALLEAPCGHPEVSGGRYSSKNTNYENGWRRASDKCGR